MANPARYTDQNPTVAQAKPQGNAQRLAADIPPGRQAPFVPAPKPHRDTQRAASTTIDGLGEIFINERLDCMLGDVNATFKNYEEKNKKSTKGQLYPVPPVGEYCLALLKHSADVQRNPQMLNESPEKSLIPPYLSLLAGQNIAATGPNALTLISSYNSFLSNPEVQALKPTSKTAMELDTLPGKAFPSTGATAFDVTFVQEMFNHTQSGVVPPRPANSKALYDTTQACFAGNTQTLGACVQAAKDQAAIYLNDVAATTNSNLPKKAPSSTPTR